MGQSCTSSRPNKPSGPSSSHSSLSGGPPPALLSTISNCFTTFKRRRVLASHTHTFPLPSELVYHILELGVEDNQTGRLKDRCEFLRTTSLVCQNWTESSKVLLWQRLWIGAEKTGKMVLKSKEFGKYRTRALSLFGTSWYEGVEMGTAKKLIEGLRGIEELNVNGYNGKDLEGWPTNDFGFLVSENLRGLTSLSLLHSTFLSKPPLTKVPYSLTSLEIRGFCATSNNPFSCFLNPNLRHLSIGPIIDISMSYFTRNDGDDYVNFFRTVAPQLKTLSFRDHIDDVLHLVELCKTLKTLDAECDAPSLERVLMKIPSEVEELVLTPFTLSHFVMRLPMILELRSVRGLRKVKFGNDRGSFKRVDGGKELLEMLNSKGVKVDFMW